MLGLVVLAGVVTGGSYLWLRSQVASSNDRVDVSVKTVLSNKPSSTLVSAAAVIPESPSAMDVLVLGSDRRANEDEKYGRSDTIILVHIDPDNDYVSLLSIPRDLRVSIPGQGKDKINAAYAYGGPALTVQTVEQLTGVDIDHYVEVDFQAFEDITDALGGVYVDVDRRYYNDDPQWELIKLSPGYQLLNGSDALDYVRFRHDRSGDFGRMARQQRFLGALREQAMGWDLPFKLPKVVSALFDNVATDLGANDILKLAYWGVNLDGNRIRQTSIVADTETIDGISYVIVNDTIIANAVEQLLRVPSSATAIPDTGEAAGGLSEPAASSATSTTVTSVDLSGVEIDVLNANGRAGEAAAAGRWLASLGAKVVTVGNASDSDVEATRVTYPRGKAEAAGLVAEALGTESVAKSSSVKRVTVVLGKDFVLPESYALPPTPDTIPNSGEWKALAKMVPFALQAPSYLPEGFTYADRMPPEGATYEIDTGNGSKPALRMMYRLKENGENTDQWMGITETTWVDAPAASKGVEVKHDGVTFTIVGTNQTVERVWWKQDGVLYWVSNTVTYVLDRDELLAVAQSMIKIPRP